MKRLLLLAFLCLAPAASAAEGWHIDVEGSAGQKRMSSEFGALRNQQSTGVKVTTSRGGRWGFATDVYSSRASTSGEGYAFAASSNELALGVRYRAGYGRFAGVAGAGVSAMETEVHTALPAFRTTPLRAFGPGLWASAGVRVAMTSRVELGVDVRQSVGRTYRGDYHVSGGGRQVGMTLGLRF